MLTSVAARAALASVLVATQFDLRAEAQATFVEPLPASELQFTIDGVPPNHGIRLWTLENFGHGPKPSQAEIAEVVRRCKEIAASAPPPQVFPPSPAAFDLQFTVNSPPAGAAAAVTAVESYFEALLTTTHASGPIQITVNFAPLGMTTIMSTASNLYSIGYSGWVAAMGANSDPDDILWPFLPASSINVQFTHGGVPTNCTSVLVTAGTIVGTYPTVLGPVTAPHATITVNSSFAFDYDPTNGIGGGLLCFRTSFAHEIGHALGFNSAISLPSPTEPTQLDFLRFQRSTSNATGFNDFKNRSRLVHNNTPNDDHESSLVFAHYAMEDGTPDQASHFREETPAIGLMDPAIGTGDTFHPNYLQTSDLRVLDFLGFDWNDPALQPLNDYRFDLEPNGAKSESSAAPAMTPGLSIIGTSTGSSTTTGSTVLASQDIFRVRTTTLPLGIYRHTLTLTSTTGGSIAMIRGLSQSTGVIGTVDSLVQFSAAIASNQSNVWYGFGKQEEVYYTVNGTGTTTACYTATLSTQPISWQTIGGNFVAGSITVRSTIGQTTDTEIYLYDSNFNPVLLGHNDDPISPVVPSGGSFVNVNLAAGTYYVAISNFNTANNQSDANPNEVQQSDPLMDFPNVVVNNQSGTTASVSYTVSDGVTTTPVNAAHGSVFDIQWGRFIVQPGAPRNDVCANALNVGTGTTNGTLLGATFDGAPTCDPGVSGSKTVWYSHTNTTGGVRLLSVNTCGTTGVNNTVLAVFSACGGSELACNDNCGGSPCGSPSSCISGVSLNPGQTVLIRVSDQALGMTTGNFTLNLSHSIPPPPNDSCTTPVSISGFGTFPIDNSAATTGTQGQAEALCNFFGGTAVRQDVWFTWTPTSSGTVAVTTCALITSGPNQDSKIAIYTGAGCPTSPAIACNDDGIPACSTSGTNPQFNATVTFAAVCGTTYTIQMGMHQAEASTMLGSFSVSGSGPACPTPTTSLCKGDGTGAPCPCGNTSTLLGSGCRSPFYGGAGATLSSAGIASITADTLVLTANNIPGPSLFIQTNPGVLVNFGDGHLCSVTAIVRMGVVFAAGGVAVYPGGTTPLPIHIAGGAANGQTKLYQCWYRSNPAMCSGTLLYNLTQALQLTWGP